MRTSPFKLSLLPLLSLMIIGCAGRNDPAAVGALPALPNRTAFDPPVTAAVETERQVILNHTQLATWAYHTNGDFGWNGRWYISAVNTGTTKSNLYSLGPLQNGLASWWTVGKAVSTFEVPLADAGNQMVRVDANLDSDPSDTFEDVGLKTQVTDKRIHDDRKAIQGKTVPVQWYFFQAPNSNWYIVNVPWYSLGPLATSPGMLAHDNLKVYKFNTKDNAYLWEPVDVAGATVQFSNAVAPSVGKTVLFTRALPQFSRPIAAASDRSGVNLGYQFMNKTGAEDVYAYHTGVDMNAADAAGVNEESGTVPALAVADGVVVGKTNDWGRLVLEHQVGGRRFYSVYGHILHLGDPALTVLKDRAALTVGDKVVRGQEVGTLSHQPYATMASHLHFEIRNDLHPDPLSPDFWGKTAGKVLLNIWLEKEVFKGYEDPTAFLDALADPATATVIVDDHLTYPGIEKDFDRALLPQAVVTKDAAGSITSVWKTRFFAGSGLTREAHAAAGQGETNYGYGGDYSWAVTDTLGSAWGSWIFDIPQGGLYEVFVSIPKGHGTTTAASYEIETGKVNPAPVKLRQVDYGNTKVDWVSLGTFDFAEGQGRSVRLSSRTSDPGTQISFDAVKVIKR
jgi:hypothetical protein